MKTELPDHIETCFETGITLAKRLCRISDKHIAIKQQQCRLIEKWGRYLPPEFSSAYDRLITEEVNCLIELSETSQGFRDHAQRELAVFMDLMDEIPEEGEKK